MPKILIAEDNFENRDMLSRRLARRGFTLCFAANGAEAVEKARSEAPDLILMDLSLPVVDGWEAARRIKWDAAHCAVPLRFIPIIALTAHAMSGDREKASRAGCDDYDTKPIDMARLLQKIARLLA